jgi:hypothetical protein
MTYWIKLLFVACLSAIPVSSQENRTDELFRAIQSEDVATLRALLVKGAGVNAKDAQGNTPLHTAAEHWAVECIELLLSKGADVNARNADGRTPLMVAANIPEALGLLLDAGADVEIRDNQGRTALMQAAALGELSKVKMLFQIGVDVASKSPGGQNALDIAIETKHQKIADLIRGESSSGLQCSKLEMKPKVLDARLIDDQNRELAIKIESSFAFTAGNSDDTFTGNLKLSLSGEERERIARWEKKVLSDVAASVEVEKVIASFTRNPKCPELELEFSQCSISEQGFLPGSKLTLDRFRLSVRLDDGELSQVICLWARNVSSGRSSRNRGHVFTEALNCAEYDLGG